MNLDEHYLRKDFAKARKKVSEGATVAAGGAGHETAYAEAYQALVKAGLEPQIPRKYRP